MKVGMYHMKIKCTYIIIMINADNQAVRQILFSGIFLFFRIFFCEQNLFLINRLFKSITVSFLFHFFPLGNRLHSLSEDWKKAELHKTMDFHGTFSPYVHSPNVVERKSIYCAICFIYILFDATDSVSTISSNEIIEFHT